MKDGGKCLIRKKMKKSSVQLKGLIKNKKGF